MNSYSILPAIPRRSVLTGVSTLACLLGIGQYQPIQMNLSACKTQCITSAKDYKTELGYRLDLYNAPDDVFVCDRYGHFLHNKWRLREAEELYLSVINLRKKRCENNCLIVIPMQGLALVYEDQGRFKEAEKLLIEGLQIRHKFDSKESLGLSESQNYLGSLYQRQSQFAKAAVCFNAALRSTIRATGRDSLTAASAMLELGDFYLVHRWEKASALYREALEIQKKKLKADDARIKQTSYRIEHLLPLYKDLDPARDKASKQKHLLRLLLQVYGGPPMEQEIREH